MTQAFFIITNAVKSHLAQGFRWTTLQNVTEKTTATSPHGHLIASQVSQKYIYYRDRVRYTPRLAHTSANYTLHSVTIQRPHRKEGPNTLRGESETSVPARSTPQRQLNKHQKAS